MAYFELPYAIDPKNPFLLDRRSGPWLSVADALANIPIEVRMPGLLVTVYDTTFMYVFEGGVADVNLVPLQAITHWGDISGVITNQTDLQPFIVEQSRASLTLTTIGSGGASTYNPTTGELNVPNYVTTMSGTVAKTSQYFTATESQTTFIVPGGYIVGSIDVYLTGVKLTATEYTATDGLTVVLTTGASADAILEVVVYGIGSFLALLYATTPLHYDNTSGVFSIQVANSTQSGYLSATDWNTFNSKLGSIILTTTGTSGAATWDGTTLNIPQYTGGGGGAFLPLAAGSGSPLTGDLYLGTHNIMGANDINGVTVLTEYISAMSTALGTGIDTNTAFISLLWQQNANEVITDRVAPIHAILTYTPTASGFSSNDATNAVILSELQIAENGMANFDVDFINIEARLTIDFADAFMSFGNYRAINIKSPIRNNYTAGGYINTYTALWIEPSLINVDGYRRAIYQEGTNDRNDFFGPIHLYNSLESTDNASFLTVSATALYAGSFVKSGGLATEYLMADGSVSTGGGGSSINFVDDEVPTGTIDNINLTFGLAHAPSPVASLKLYLNGQKLFAGDDFTILGTIITMTTAIGTGNKLRADYRY